MGELRGQLAAAGTALMAVGIGLVILAEPALSPRNDSLAWAGWSLVGLGGLALALSLVWTIRSATKKPNLTIKCGTTELFRREERAQDCHWHLEIGTTPSAVYMTRLVVRETTKKVSARDVHIHVTASDPPFPPDAPQSLPVELEWTTRETGHNLGPGARGYVYLCEMVTYADNSDWNWVYGHIADAVLGPGKKVCLSLQPVIDGQTPSRKTIQSFLVDWTEGEMYPTVTAMPR